MTETNRHRPTNHRGMILFVLAQILFLAGVGGATGWRVSERKRHAALPVPNEKPIRIQPTYDYPWVISDEQLKTVLTKLRPALRGPNPAITHVDHALRFWGADARFDDPAFLSGRELRELLLIHERFAQAWGKDTASLVVNSRNGVSIRTQEGKAAASHVDHTLAALAEVGTPLSVPVRGPDAVTTVRALLENSLREFSLNQVEYEWSTLTYALYLPPVKSWVSKEGQDISFDILAERIMRQTYSQGVCFGNHRLHTLTMLLRVDDSQHILEPSTRQHILDHLQEATRRLVQNQHEYGYWDGDWSSQKPLEKDRTDQSLANKILATGHALEWWALAPTELHPPREVLTRAGQWLAKTIGEMDDADVKKNYTFLTHAGRALAIWRGHEPAYFVNTWWPAKTTVATNENAKLPKEQTNADDAPDAN